MLINLGNLLPGRFEDAKDLVSDAQKDAVSSGALVDAEIRSQHQESAHPSQSVSDPPDIFSRACLGVPIDMMNLLIEKEAHIEALFRNIGIHHDDLCFCAGFDEEVFTYGGMFIQQAYFLCYVDLVADEADVFTVLDELAKILSPYSAIISTPSRQYLSPGWTILHDDDCA